LPAVTAGKVLAGAAGCSCLSPKAELMGTKFFVHYLPTMYLLSYTHKYSVRGYHWVGKSNSGL